MNAHIKNTANGGNNNAPQYKTNESNVAVKNRGIAKPSLARRKFCCCCSPRANSSFVPSCGVFKNPVVLIVSLFLFTRSLFCALDSSSSERGIIFPIRLLWYSLLGGKRGFRGTRFTTTTFTTTSSSSSSSPSSSVCHTLSDFLSL